MRARGYIFSAAEQLHEKSYRPAPSGILQTLRNASRISSRRGAKAINILNLSSLLCHKIPFYLGTLVQTIQVC